jgi:hypothetical protein
VEKSKVDMKRRSIHFTGKYHEAYLQVSSAITRLKSLDYDVESFLKSLDFLLKRAKQEGRQEIINATQEGKVKASRTRKHRGA